MSSPFVVVNHLPIRPDADWDDLTIRFDGFCPGFLEQTGVRFVSVMRGEGDEAILVVVFDDEATGKRLSAEVAAPWFAENIRPFLAGPASRSAASALSWAGPESA